MKLLIFTVNVVLRKGGENKAGLAKMNLFYQLDIMYSANLNAAHLQLLSLHAVSHTRFGSCLLLCDYRQTSI